MTVSLGSSLASEGICLFVDLCWLVEGAALSRRTQNEIVVSWITLSGMIKETNHSSSKCPKYVRANKHSPSLERSYFAEYGSDSPNFTPFSTGL